MKTERKIMHVVRIAFDVETVVKDEAFTPTGRLKKALKPNVAALLRYSAHDFINNASLEDLIKNAKITQEEVDVEIIEDEEAPDESNS